MSEETNKLSQVEYKIVLKIVMRSPIVNVVGIYPAETSVVSTPADTVSVALPVNATKKDHLEWREVSPEEIPAVSATQEAEISAPDVPQVKPAENAEELQETVAPEQIKTSASTAKQKQSRPPTGRRPEWPRDHSDLAKKLYTEDGWSAEQIAKRLSEITGRIYTTPAVQGRIRRGEWQKGTAKPQQEPVVETAPIEPTHDFPEEVQPELTAVSEPQPETIEPRRSNCRIIPERKKTYFKTLYTNTTHSMDQIADEMNMDWDKEPFTEDELNDLVLEMGLQRRPVAPPPVEVDDAVVQKAVDYLSGTYSIVEKDGEYKINNGPWVPAEVVVSQANGLRRALGFPPLRSSS